MLVHKLRVCLKIESCFFRALSAEVDDIDDDNNNDSDYAEYNSDDDNETGSDEENDEDSKSRSDDNTDNAESDNEDIDEEQRNTPKPVWHEEEVLYEEVPDSDQEI